MTLLSGRELVKLVGHLNAVDSCAWSPDGTRLASTSDDPTVRVWACDTWSVTATLRGHEDTVWMCAWSPDGRRLASASSDKTVVRRCWLTQSNPR
jgi:WD40 repeat protein